MAFLGDLSGSQALANMAGNLAQNSAMNQGQQAAMQQQQADYAAQQAMLNNLYGSQGFGGQTADYAAAGAAYGRATGGFGGYGGNNDIYGVGNPSGSVERGPDLPNISGAPTYGGPVAYDFRSGQAPPVEQPVAYDFRTAQQPAQDWSAYFTQLTNPAMDATPAPSYGGGGAFSGGGIYGGSTPAGMPDYMKLLGYTPDASLGWQSQAPAYTPPPAAQYFSQQPQAPYQDYGYPAAYDFRTAQASPVGQPAAYDFRTALQAPASFDDRFGMGFDPNSFDNRLAAGGYYQPGTPSQISGYAPNGYDPLSGQAPPYTYQPGFVQGPGGPGDWVPQQIPGMNTLTPNDMTYSSPPGYWDNSGAGG